jgi:lipopolysaccharide/colanic/teichoic acid biosynthesis glycosyltransferase
LSWMNNRTHINIVQIIADIICLAVTYALSMFLTDEIFRQVAFAEYLWIPVLFSMVYVFTMFTCEMYHRSTFTYQDRTLKYVMKSCLFAAVFCFVMIPFTTKDVFTVNILLIYILAAIIIISMQYLIIQELRHAVRSRWKKRAVIVGLQENIQEYLYFINKTSFQVDVAGCITLDNPDGKSGLGKIEDMEDILKKNIVDEIIFAIPCSLMEDMRKYVLLCKNRGLTVRLAVDFFEGQNQSSSVYSVGTIPVFTYQNATLSDLQLFVKRLMDISGAILGLLYTAIVSVFIVPLIRIQVGGTVLIKKNYLSLNGRSFTLYCFNTGTENGKRECFTSRLLRKTGMCNLPMFWNVLKGEMSLVGSLPILAENGSNQEVNITLKPGLTGLWRFIDRSMLNDYGYLTELSNRYLYKWSFIRDIWLIFKTIVFILAIKTSGMGTSLFSCLEENSSYGLTT